MDNLILKYLMEGYITERLYLRPLTISDTKDMLEYTSDYSVCRYLSWGPHIDITETKVFIEKVLSKYLDPKDIIWGIQYNNKLIGVVRIYNIDFDKGESVVSYILNRKYQGLGFMTEAINGVIDFCFNFLGISKVIAFYIEENIESLKVMERCNMKKVSDFISETVIKGYKRKLLKCEIEKEF
jgi:ribosomal-protein-alanine N-acetyltransferase